MAERFATIGPKLEAVAGGLTQGRDIHDAQFKREEENVSPSDIRKTMELGYSHKAAKKRQIEAELKNPRDSWDREKLEHRLERANESHSHYQSEMRVALQKAEKDKGLKGNAYWETLKELQGPRGLYHTAEEAGLTEPQLKAIKGERLDKQTGSIMAALEKINKVNVEKEKEENAKIELSGEALRWFKLKFPNAKTPKEEAGEGGKSTASGAANPSVPGETVAYRAAQKAGEKMHRNEPTSPSH